MTGPLDLAPSGDARLDPWCVVPLDTGETVLFGFATSHPVTGGLSWTVTSELLELNRAGNGAKTLSGRRYVLGRRFAPLDVGAEGEEARLAFASMVEREFEGQDALRKVEELWLTSCKMGRHLGVEPPPRRSSEIRQFLRQHGDAYLAARSRRR